MAAELGDFLRFVRRPDLRRPFVRAASPTWRAEWLQGLVPGRLLRWVLLLWVVNLTVFGPLAVDVAGLSGAEHRLVTAPIPWPHIVLLAPLIEEVMFRYGLRRPARALVLIPFLASWQWLGAAVLGPWVFLAVLAVVGGALVWADVHWRPATLRGYRRLFPWVFHVAALGFALMHLSNFALGAGARWWLLPLLVLPQYVTGLVLGWMRVRFGMGACLALHAMFNAGPMLLISLIRP